MYSELLTVEGIGIHILLVEYNMFSNHSFVEETQLQPAVQQQETDDTLLQSTSHHSFEPSHKCQKTSTCELLLYQLLFHCYVYFSFFSFYVVMSHAMSAGVVFSVMWIPYVTNTSSIL